MDVCVGPSTFSKSFFSETAWQIKAKFYSYLNFGQVLMVGAWIRLVDCRDELDIDLNTFVIYFHLKSH